MSKGYRPLSEIIDYRIKPFDRNNNFGTFTKLLDEHIDIQEYPDREKRARSIVLFIVKRLFHYVVMDMILENVEFVFPYKVFFLSIRSRKMSSKKYRFNIDTGGHDYIPYITAHYSKKNKLRRMFLLKLSKPYMEILNNEIKRGHKYDAAPDKHFRK